MYVLNKHPPDGADAGTGELTAFSVRLCYEPPRAPADPPSGPPLPPLAPFPPAAPPNPLLACDGASADPACAADDG